MKIWLVILSFILLSLASCADIKSRCGLAALETQACTTVEWNNITTKYPYPKVCIDFWPSPLVTYELGWADCRGLATLSCDLYGKEYGTKLLIVYGEVPDPTGRYSIPIGHALHLLVKDGKYGLRGRPTENIEPTFININDLILTYETQIKCLTVKRYFVINIKDLSWDWQTTRKSLEVPFEHLFDKPLIENEVIRPKEKVNDH